MLKLKSEFATMELETEAAELVLAELEMADSKVGIQTPVIEAMLMELLAQMTKMRKKNDEKSRMVKILDRNITASGRVAKDMLSQYFN